MAFSVNRSRAAMPRWRIAFTRANASVSDTPSFSARECIEFVQGPGRGYQTPGGLKSTEHFSRQFKLVPGMKVIDVGCGPGGAAFHMAAQYDVEAVGVDNAPLMVSLCRSLQAEAVWPVGKGSLAFVEGSMLDVSLFDDGIADLVWTRGAMVSLSPAEKDSALANLFRWLKPGGKLLINDFGSRETLEEYSARVASAGFDLSFVGDISMYLLSLYKEDLIVFKQRRAAFEAMSSPSRYQELLMSAAMKFAATEAAIEDGSLQWFCFVGRKL